MRISKSPEIPKDLAQDRGPVNPSKAVRPHLPKQGALLRMLGLNVDRALKVADAELPPGTVLNNTTLDGTVEAHVFFPLRDLAWRV